MRRAGVLVALDTLNGFNEFIYERCDSSVVEEIKSLDGHIYQIPWKINPIMLIYNVNLINELELTESPPKPTVNFSMHHKNFKKILMGMDMLTDGLVIVKLKLHGGKDFLIFILCILLLPVEHRWLKIIKQLLIINMR